MHKLNDAQQQAVVTVGSPLLVLAGAGSGKTRVITEKIAFLVRECGIPARNIAAVTFTNKAAREMKQRASALLNGREGRGLKVSTFHTLGLTMLRREAGVLGYRAGMSIYDAEDSRGLLRELMRREGQGSDNVDGIQNLISNWKGQLLDPDQAALQSGDDLQAYAARVYLAYQGALKIYNAVDFDDLIRIPVSLLKTNQEVLARWRSSIRYLLVDEYQDTNQAQYELVRALVGPRSGLTVVGDDDQSIYSWRGARPENLVSLNRDFPAIKLIKLEQNYRSHGRILASANALISNNPHVFEKALWSAMEPGEKLRVLSTRDERDEAERVVSEILTHRFRKNGSYGEYAILYRGNFQARVFEKALREQNIPYSLQGGTAFFERSEVRDMVAYLRLLINPDDDTAFLRVVNTPRREIGPGTLQGLSSYAAGRGISLGRACGEMGLAQHLSERAVDRLGRFSEWLKSATPRYAAMPPTQVVSGLLDDTGYADWLYEGADNPRAAERRIKNVSELGEWMGRLAAKKPGRTLGDLVSTMCLMGILERNQDDEDEPPSVRLMTLHSAKGLEFPHVFLVGMEEELLPHRTSIEEDNLEEERRLAYVGITRARETLTFTLARKRKRFGELVRCAPSRFLDELPEQHLLWEGRPGDQPDPAESQARGKAHLANLRGMLGTS
jgi:ATP-dependent DNA helicase Rep